MPDAFSAMFDSDGPKCGHICQASGQDGVAQSAVLEHLASLSIVSAELQHTIPGYTGPLSVNRRKNPDQILIGWSPFLNVEDSPPEQCYLEIGRTSTLVTADFVAKQSGGRAKLYEWEGDAEYAPDVTQSSVRTKLADGIEAIIYTDGEGGDAFDGMILDWGGLSAIEWIEANYSNGTITLDGSASNIDSRWLAGMESLYTLMATQMPDKRLIYNAGQSTSLVSQPQVIELFNEFAYDHSTASWGKQMRTLVDAGQCSILLCRQDAVNTADAARVARLALASACIARCWAVRTNATGSYDTAWHFDEAAVDANGYTHANLGGQFDSLRWLGPSLGPALGINGYRVDTGTGDLPLTAYRMDYARGTVFANLTSSAVTTKAARDLRELVPGANAPWYAAPRPNAGRVYESENTITIPAKDALLLQAVVPLV